MGAGVQFDPRGASGKRSATSRRARQSKACFGRRDLPIYKLDQAETIISFGADFVRLGSPVEYARQFAQFRAPKTPRWKLSSAMPPMSVRGSTRPPRSATNGSRRIRGPRARSRWRCSTCVVNQGWVSGGDAAGLKALDSPDYDPEKVGAEDRSSADQIKRIAAVVRTSREAPSRWPAPPIRSRTWRQSS